MLTEKEMIERVLYPYFCSTYGCAAAGSPWTREASNLRPSHAPTPTSSIQPLAHATLHAGGKSAQLQDEVVLRVSEAPSDWA